MEIKLTNAQAATLGQLFGEAAMFASANQMRPILTGVLFTSNAGKLRMVATDSYALGILTSSTIDAPDGFRTLVTASELATIGKALAKLKPTHYGDQPTVTLTFGERELVAECDAWRLTARVIDGDFPNYEQLVPVGDGNAENGWPVLSTHYLAVLAKVRCAKPAPTKRHPTSVALRFELFGALKPCRITLTGEHADFLGLLMPVRI